MSKNVDNQSGKGLNVVDSFEMPDKKKEIIKMTWEYLLKTGLTQASIGDLCREAKLAQSSLYYWFVNKDDIWISAGKYGLSKVVDALLTFTFDHVDKTNVYFETLLDETEKHKEELRLAIQITTNSVYGERMREKAKDFRFWYEQYAHKLMSIFSCTYLQAETFIYTIIACIIDFAIWDDREKSQMLLDNLHKRIIRALGTETEQL